MKRKLALLLAVAMTLSLLPMNLFAASENRLTSYPTTTGNKTVFVERGTMNTSATGEGRYGVGGVYYPTGINAINPGVFSDTDIVYRSYTDTVVEIDGHDDIDYVTDAPYFEIEPKNSVPAGSRFQITLENAKWFFRNPGGDKWTGNAGVVTGTALEASKIPATSAYSAYRRVGASTNQFGLARTYRYIDTTPGREGNPLYSDLTTLGRWIPEGGSNFAGSYIRYEDNTAARAAALVNQTVNQARNDTSVVYILSVSGANDRVATVEIPNELLYQDDYELSGGASKGKFWIPLVSRTTSEDDVKVIVSDTGNSGITAGTFVYSASSVASTRTYVDDPKTAKEEFPINILAIKELKVASMETGVIEISAPTGFYFSERVFDNLQIWAENFGYGNSVVIGSGLYTGASADFDGAGPSANADCTGGIAHAYMRFKPTTTRTSTDYDYSVIQIRFADLSSNKSTRIPGTIYLKSSANPNDFILFAEDTASYGDIMMKIRNRSKDVVTEESFKAGTRKDWSIDFTTITSVPTLINGRYEDFDAKNADDDQHLAAKISFKELIPDAWWSRHETIFELPEGVKFRKVDITKVEKIPTTDADSLKDHEYLNTGKRDGKVTVDGRLLKLTNITRPTGGTDKALMEMEVWLSIESGWEGDITLTASGSAVPDDLDPLVIAKAVSPVEVVTSVTDVLIGYQYYPVADVELVETGAGMIQKSKKVYLSVTDRINMDMYFAPGFKAEVTEGNIKISSVNIGGYAKVDGSKLDLGGGTIVFDVDGASSSASTIKFSNLQLKIDRTVPETQIPYEVFAWGPNIAPNYDGYDYEYTHNVPASYEGSDQFSELGISAPYVRVVSASPEKSNILSSVVKVTIDSNTAYVNGEQVAIDPAAYIDGGRTMIPLRALSTLLGVREEQIIWSDSARTVTINMPSRVVQFTIGSNVMLVNGAGIEIEVPATIKGGRTFIPFRALGEGLSVKVTWDETTRTATYNEQ